MDVILFSIKWQLAPVYLDPIVILSKTPERHIGQVQKVFLLLNKAIATYIDYLGNVIYPRKLGLASHPTGPICRPKPPSRITE